MPEQKPIDKKTARHIRALVITQDDALKGRPWRSMKAIKRALKAGEIDRPALDAHPTHDPEETPGALIYSTTRTTPTSWSLCVRSSTTTSARQSS
ncbi:hypothetical protein [Microbacterium sp.]|uniref:hypothetical protein n=1 Tax=Microbacterium sp. TaxID=51671 RepID=UPI003565045D